MQLLFVIQTILSHK